MTNDDEQNQRKVGYRNPPQSGQFQKGGSGNPRGRPRKRRDAATLPDHRDPTVREVIGAQIKREITINNHHGRHTITAKQAVIRAMAVTALKGGVLAQRSFVEVAATEEARHQKEKRRSFRFWRDYKEVVAARIAAGGPRPGDDPNPDDIRLDWRTQKVRVEDPFDREDRAAAEAVCAVRHLAYEMTIYHGEALHMCDTDGRLTQMGAYMGYYLEYDRSSVAALPEAAKGLWRNDHAACGLV